MKHNFTKNDIGKKILITYDLEKFPRPKAKKIGGRKRKVSLTEVAIGLGAEIIDRAEILNVNTKEKYIEIKTETYAKSDCPIMKVLNKEVCNEKIRVPYDWIKEYKFLK